MSFELSSRIDPELWSLVDETRAFYAHRPAGRGPGSLEELLAFRAGAPAPAECDPQPVIEQASALGQSVPVRIHSPVSSPVAGVFLEIHGGGFYMGSAAGSDVRNRRLADALGVAVVSVDYRLAPEHPWPSAPDDCETAALWLVEQAESRFGTAKLAVGGFSAGSTLAVSTLVRLRDRGVTAFSGGVLQFGTYDLAAKTEAGRLIADEYFLDAYAGTAPDRATPTFHRSSPTLLGCRRSLSWLAATTSFWKTISPWPRGCLKPVSRSTCVFIPHPLMDSPDMRRPWH
jgi:acetyl esterase